MNAVFLNIETKLLYLLIIMLLLFPINLRSINIYAATPHYTGNHFALDRRGMAFVIQITIWSSTR